MRFTKTLRFRLIVVTVLCTAVVSLVGNLALFGYLNNILNQRADRIDEIYLSTLQNQLDEYLTDLSDLAILCSSDYTVSRALSPAATMKNAVDAQDRLNAYLATSAAQDYIDVLSVVNGHGVVAAATTQTAGDLGDYDAICAQEVYRQAVEAGALCTGVAPSIHGGDPVLAFVRPIQGLGSRPGQLCEIGGAQYQVTGQALALGGLTLYHCALQTALDQEGLHIVYTVATVLALSLLLAVCLAVLTSAYFSRPVSRLNARLRRIAANDFSFDPEIEKPQDELGQIGRTVNEMSMSIQHLLQETEEMYTQRRNIEIALLQSQVNPHFLYNTLDSIRWMAVIQKNPGIASITHSLSNLLKNIAKGTQDKITLAEELGLLQDYIAIQAVRYVEMFTFVNEVPQELYACRIVKLTLQSLVENAIFHGIEPTGECGTITMTGTRTFTATTEDGSSYTCALLNEETGINCTVTGVFAG